MSVQTNLNHRKEKISVALGSVLASAIMTAAKFLVGILTGSLGVVSEALHSLFDFGAAALTLFAVHVSDKPPDEEHSYGHGKIESVAALVETALLFITSAWIVYEAGQRLITKQNEVNVTWWSIAVIVFSMAIDVTRAKALTRVAKKTGSHALEADALHFSSDVLSSAVVLLGLLFVAKGYQTADAIAAIGVAGFICIAGWRLGKRTIDVLIDAAPKGSLDYIRKITAGIQGVVKVEKVRARPVGKVLLIEVEIAVGRSLSQNNVEKIRRDVAKAIKEKIPDSEITIISHPLALDSETVHERAMIIARDSGAQIHHITVYNANGKMVIGLDLEVDGNISIGKAHEFASEIENKIRAEFGGDIEVETHIEPMQTKMLAGREADLEEFKENEKVIQKIIKENGFFTNLHKVRIRHTDEGIVIMFHCRVPPHKSVLEVHKEADKIERALREIKPNICRVVCHAEPERLEKKAELFMQ